MQQVRQSLSPSLSMMTPPPPPPALHTALCFRHRPTAPAAAAATDRPDFEALLAPLSPTTRSTVTRIWSDFSAASAGVRDTILLGLVDASCMRQITTLRAATAVAHRMDLVTALPVELSLRIMQCLDARSLARAAQVSRSWAPLANADAVWQRMCLQHIDKKCAKCGWGLPRLTRKRRRIGASDPASDAARSAVAAVEARSSNAVVSAVVTPPPVALAPAPALPGTSGPGDACAGQMPVLSTTPSSSLSAPSSAAATPRFMHTRRSPGAHGARSGIPVSALLNPSSGETDRSAAAADSGMCSDDEHDDSGGAASSSDRPPSAKRRRMAPSAFGAEYDDAAAELMLHLASSTAASVNAATTASTTSTGSATVATTTSAQSPPPTTTTAPTPTPTTAVVRRSWKAVYAERLVVGRNWKNDRHVAYALVPPVASLQPRVTAVHLDEPYLLTSAMDGLVRLWHVETRTCVRTLAGHRGAVTCVHFDEPHGLAVTGGMDGTVRLWNWAAGTMVRTLAGGHSVPVTALYFANGVLATADAASLIRVWDFAAKSCFALNHGNMCAVTKVALCRGSLFSAGDDGVVRMWDLNTRSCIRTFAPPRQQPAVAAAQPPLSPVSSSSGQSNGAATPPSTAGAAAATHAPAVSGLHVAQVHVHGGHAVYVLTGSADGMVHLYDTTLSSASPSSSASTTTGWPAVAATTATTCLPDASSSSSSFQPRSVAPVVAPLLSLSHGAPVTSVWFDSLRIATCGADGNVHLWDMDSGARLRTYPVGGAAGVVVGSDTRIVCAREDGVVHVWDFGRQGPAAVTESG